MLGRYEERVEAERMLLPRFIILFPWLARSWRFKSGEIMSLSLGQEVGFVGWMEGAGRAHLLIKPYRSSKQHLMEFISSMVMASLDIG